MNRVRTFVARRGVQPLLPLVLAFVLAACGGGGAPEPVARERSAALSSAGDGQLVERVRGLLRQRRAALAATPGAMFDRAAAPALEVAVGANGAPIAASNTTVQEPGVDEADLLKSQGRVLYALDAYTLNIAGTLRHQIRVARTGSDGSVEPLQGLPLPLEAGFPTPHGLLLAATAPRLIALAENLNFVGLPQPCPPGFACIASLVFAPGAVEAQVQVQAADIAGDGTLTLGRRLSIQGRLVASRRVGDVVYLVTTHTPRLAAEQLPAGATPDEAEAALAAIKAGDILPTLRIDGGAAQPLLAESDCLLQPTTSSNSITLTSVVAIDLASPTLARAARCFLGGTEALYMSAAHLYLATTRSPEVTVQGGRVVYAPQFVTDIHKFAFSGLGLNYRASGEVTGHLGWDAQRMALRMGEHNGDLRVLSYTGGNGWAMPADATTAGGPAPSPATLTVLRERTTDATLQPVATLPNASRPALLGKPGEQVYGVRFAGDRAYLVTFRQVDPLYVLDLSNAADPRAAGVLEVPGFSDHLLPLAGGLLFGVGRDADAAGFTLGLKVALFDVRDAARPSLIAAQTFGARGSTSALDSSVHGLNLMMAGAQARLALPMSLRATDFGEEAEQALHRFEVDSAARTLVMRPRLAAPASTAPYDLSGDRSLQIGDAVFYLTQGRLLGAPW